MLEQLYAVQQKDLELDVFDAEKQKTPEELIQLRKDHEVLAANLSKRETARNDLRKQVNSNELDLETLSERRKASADAALHAQSAKEASQYQNQELQFATRLQELEEDTLPLLERLEAEQAGVEDLETQMAELEPKLAAMTAEEEARIVSIDENMASVKLERQALAHEVSASLLKQYEQVRRSKRGLGMAIIANGKSCGGCNMQLPIHVMQKAKKDTAVTRCPSCGRILWFKPATI